MKTIVMMGVVLGVMVAGAITVNESGDVDGARNGRVVVRTSPPRYSLNEAIEMCADELEARGETVTSATVKNRLTRMPESDVDLNVDSLSRTIREVLEARDARKAKDSPAPDVAKYTSREKFVADYAAWKMKGLTPAEKKEMHGRMGAETKFKNAAKAEANAIWTEKEKGKAP